MRLKFEKKILRFYLFLIFFRVKLKICERVSVQIYEANKKKKKFT